MTTPPLTVHKDTDVPRAWTFYLPGEGHTLGEWLVYKLHQNPDVTFAAAKVPHPMQHDQLEIRVHTTDATTPGAALMRANDEGAAQVAELWRQLQQQVVVS